jgi:lipopolysaccharide transport system permease protein
LAGSLVGVSEREIVKVPPVEMVPGFAGTPPTVSIQPPRPWEPLQLAEVWRHRHVLLALLRRDLKTRYRQTMLGPLWFILTPLVRMAMFTIVFGKIAQLPSEGVPYPLFTYTALLPWELFAAAVQRSTASLVKYQGIIPKVYFPRLILPLSEALSALTDFGCSLVILIGIMFLYGVHPTARVLLLPFFMLLAIAAGLAVGLPFAALQVRYRDTSQFVGYLLPAWSYATPVAYSATLVAKRFPGVVWVLYRLNPMFGVVEGFRWMFLGTGQAPDWTLVLTTLVVLLVLVRSAILFQRTEHLVVDLL